MRRRQHAWQIPTGLKRWLREMDLHIESCMHSLKVPHDTLTLAPDSWHGGSN